MRKFGNHLFAASGLIMFLLAIGIVTMRPVKSVTGTPTPVLVTNTSTHPVPNRDLDNAAQQPFAWTLGPSSSVSSTATDSFTVPAGKRLVIEYYSAQLTQYPSGGYAYMYLITSTGGQTSYYKAVPPASDTTPRNQLTRLYADPGTTVTGWVTQSSGTSCGGNIILSGYYVNIP